MGIFPGASVQAKIDLTRSTFTKIVEKRVATGQNVTEEGQIMVRVDDGGLEAVQPSDASSDVPMGVALCDQYRILTFTAVEEGVIPLSSPYTIALNRGSIVASTIRVRNMTAGSDMVESTDGTPATGEADLNETTGVVTFNSAQAGASVKIWYTYNLTAADVVRDFGTRAINNAAQEFWATMSVGIGICEVYTSHYDTTQVWAINDQATTGAGGKFTKGGGGANFGKVISLPSVDDPYLGIAYTTP